MKESIKVIVRIKPIVRGNETCLRVAGDAISVAAGALHKAQTPSRSDTAPIQLFGNTETPQKQKYKTKSISFRFDKIHDQTAKQTEIFEDIHPYVADAIRGYNTSIFAYGQTGSGKTFTMMGEGKRDNRGVIPRAVQDIFQEIEVQRQEEDKFSVYCSFVELHLDQFTDLLDPNNDPQVQKKMLPHQIIDMNRKRKIEVRQNGKEIFLSGSETLNTPVTDYHMAMKLIEHGEMCRSVAKTSLNAQSSRSHAIISFVIEKKGADGSFTRGKIHLIDLAGNERLSQSKATGETMKETQNINASLEALATVLTGLATKNNLIRYRDSKLTRFLQDSLGGNSKTCFVINVRSDAQFYRETIQSLKYGQRAKLIKHDIVMNEEKNERNSSISSEVLEKLNADIESLKTALQNKTTQHEHAMKSNKQITSENKQLRRRLRSLHAQHVHQEQQYHRKIDNLIHSQSTQLAENRYQYLKLQSNIGCYRKQIYDLTCDIAMYQQKNYLLSTTSQQGQGEIHVLQENTEQLLAQRDELQETLLDCTASMKNMKNEIKDLEEQLKESEECLEEANQETERLRDFIASQPLPQPHLSSVDINTSIDSVEKRETEDIGNPDDTTESEDEEEEEVALPTPADDSFEVIEVLEDIDDDFMPNKAKTKARKPSTSKRTKKQTPKTIGRKRTSGDFFSIPFSPESGDVSPTPFIAIDQVKPLAKKRKLNGSSNTLHLNNTTNLTSNQFATKGANTVKSKLNKKGLKNIFLPKSSFDSRLQLEDKENFSLIQ